MASTRMTATSTSTSSSDTITTVAMTTVFTPPASCSHSWTYEPEASNNVLGGLIAQNCAVEDGYNTACFPSDFDHYGRAAQSKVFSPGYCPEGYASTGLSIDHTLTSAVCCLSGFLTTTSVLANGGIFSGCTSIFSDSSTVVPKIHSTANSTTLTGTYTMWAQPIHIAWEDKDLSLFTSATRTSASTSVTLTSSTTPKQSSESSGSSGLSTGASIGIGVGVGIAGMSLLLGFVFWFLYRRKTAKKPTNELDTNDSAGIEYRRSSRNVHAAELPSNDKKESHTHELDASGNIVHEFPAS